MTDILLLVQNKVCRNVTEITSLANNFSQMCLRQLNLFSKELLMYPYSSWAITYKLN